MKKLIAVLALAALSGCGALYVDRPYRQIESRSFDAMRYWPANGAQTTTQVGDPMIYASVVAAVPTAILSAPIKRPTPYSATLKMQLEIVDLELLLTGIDDQGGKYFQAPHGIGLAYESRGAFPKPDPYRGGIHVAANGKRSIYWFWEGATTSASTIPAPDIDFKEGIRERPAKDSAFRRELIYSGLSQTTMSIMYREYIDDRVRPAFSQDLKYDSAKGAAIGYKGARIEVMSAGNTSITYRVTAPLEDPQYRNADEPK